MPALNWCCMVAAQPLGSLSAALCCQVSGVLKADAGAPCGVRAAPALLRICWQHAMLQSVAPACACSCVMPLLQGPGHALCHGSVDDALLCCAPWGAPGSQLRLLGQQHQVGWIGSRV